MTGFKRKKGESVVSFNQQDVIPLCALLPLCVLFNDKISDS